jgi:hypothetical protein
MIGVGWGNIPISSISQSWKIINKEIEQKEYLDLGKFCVRQLNKTKY